MLKTIFMILCLMIFTLPAQAADFKWMDNHANIHNLTDEYKGQPVILHFWASWCPPCVAEMPEMTAWLKQHPEVKVLPISLDQDIATVQKFLQANQLALPALLSDQNQASKWGVRGLPTSILLDAKGSVIISRIGSQNWQQGSWTRSVLALFQPTTKNIAQE